MTPVRFVATAFIFPFAGAPAATLGELPKGAALCVDDWALCRTYPRQPTAVPVPIPAGTARQICSPSPSPTVAADPYSVAFGDTKLGEHAVVHFLPPFLFLSTARLRRLTPEGLQRTFGHRPG